MILADTNIFLEILLNQEKGNICKNFLNNNSAEILISLTNKQDVELGRYTARNTYTAKEKEEKLKFLEYFRVIL